MKPRKKNPIKQIFANSICLSTASVLVAPLERSRILLQTAPLSNFRQDLPVNTRGMLPYIAQSQGYQALWRGVMPQIYGQWVQVILKVAFYDKFKHYMMPYDRSKYGGLDYFIRSQVAAASCMGLSLAFTYPFDLLHTRLTADCTPTGRQRIYSSTFQCFNRTNLEEGRWGCYKGFEFAISAALIRAMFQLPVYDLVKYASSQVGFDADNQSAAS